MFLSMLLYMMIDLLMIDIVDVMLKKMILLLIFMLKKNDLNKEIRIDSEFLFINKLLKKMTSREKKSKIF